MKKKLPKLMEISFAWFDGWVGVYVDPENFTFYLCIFTLLFTFIYPPTWKLPDKRKIVLWTAYKTPSKEVLDEVIAELAADKEFMEGTRYL